jgi:Helix-turn-helix domain
MRWVASEDCKVKGPARAVLWVIAFHADRDTGECWVGQRRLARESGFARSTIQRALEELFGDGVLEAVEDHQGPLPERFQIAPSLVEGEAGISGVVEGQAGGSRLVEGQAVVGEVIHNPSASGPGASPQAMHDNFLLDRSGDASGPIGGPVAALVDRSAEVTGPTTSALSSENGSQGFKQGSLTSREEQVLGDASSAADAAGVAEAYEPPPVDEATKEHLRRRGLGQRRPPPPIARPPTAAADPAVERDRDYWLAELKRRYPDDFKSGQEGEASA